MAVGRRGESLMTVVGTKAKAVSTSPSLTPTGAAEELAYEINTARLEVAEEYSDFLDGKSFSVHATSMSHTVHADEVGRFYAVAVVEYQVMI